MLPHKAYELDILSLFQNLSRALVSLKTWISIIDSAALVASVGFISCVLASSFKGIQIMDF